MTKKNTARTAIVYDFDGTLARGNIQEHSFLPELGVDSSAFWKDVKADAKKHDADEILLYMWRMLELARRKNKPITDALLRRHGRRIRQRDVGRCDKRTSDLRICIRIAEQERKPPLDDLPRCTFSRRLLKRDCQGLKRSIIANFEMRSA